MPLCKASPDSYLFSSSPCSHGPHVYGLLVYIAAVDTIAPVLKAVAKNHGGTWSRITATRGKDDGNNYCAQ